MKISSSIRISSVMKRRIIKLFEKNMCKVFNSEFIHGAFTMKLLFD